MLLYIATQAVCIGVVVRRAAGVFGQIFIFGLETSDWLFTLICIKKLSSPALYRDLRISDTGNGLKLLFQMPCLCPSRIRKSTLTFVWGIEYERTVSSIQSGVCLWTSLQLQAAILPLIYKYLMFCIIVDSLLVGVYW